MLGLAKAIGALGRFGSDEREAEIEGMIRVDLGTDVGSKKTATGIFNLVVWIDWDGSHQFSRADCSVTQCL
jgi:hypothetical protein